MWRIVGVPSMLICELLRINEGLLTSGIFHMHRNQPFPFIIMAFCRFRGWLKRGRIHFLSHVVSSNYLSLLPDVLRANRLRHSMSLRGPLANLNQLGKELSKVLDPKSAAE